MKNVLLFLLFLTFTSYSYSQDFSKKWNSVYQRYDYYNSNGYLIGYEKWNQNYQRWDYTNVNTNNFGKRVHQVEQPVEQGGNLELAMKVANEKQRRYDINKAKLDEHVLFHQKGIYLIGKFDAKASYEESSRVGNIFISLVNNLLSKNYDISSDSTLRYLMSTITDYAEKVPCTEWSVCN